MRDLASSATNFRLKPCKLSLISSKLESICKIKVGKYEIKLTVFKVLLFLLRFPTYFCSYLTSFVSIDRYNLNLLVNLCNNYIHVTNTRSSWAIYAHTTFLAPGQTSLFSCAESITFEFDTGATVERCEVRPRT